MQFLKDDPNQAFGQVGATSGIGRALGLKMLNNGVSVIGVGRRQENLDDFVKEGGAGASSSNFDITKLSDIPSWAASIHKSHPDLDLVVINSGIQRGFDFAKTDSVDLNTVNEEFTTNYLSYIHLAMAFLPYLQERSKSASAGIAFTTSGLALVPLMRCANYCASKAALHHWILVLREQLKAGPGNVKCIELIPPAVQTELHDEKHQPDIKDGRSMGIPLDQYTNETWEGLLAGKDQVPVSFPTQLLQPDGFEGMRQAFFRKFNNLS